jgi:CheY-like chemotaxis protein
VKDTGIGIAKENQAHLFEVFSQTDNSMTRKYGGSGLGLSICQQIVKLLGGEIKLNSHLGAGSEFSFILPFALPQEELIEQSNFYKMSTHEVSSIHLCNINQILSASYIESIKSLSWRYHQFDDLTKLNQTLTHQKSIKDKVILLLDEKSLMEPNLTEELINNINLIGLCQPTTCELKRETCLKLDELKVPHILLDTPLYRYSLEQIDKALFCGVAEGMVNEITKKSSITHENRILTQQKIKSKSNDLSNVKILLVEDNLVNQLVAKELLMSMRATVMIAENGQKALDLLDEQLFDIVLMDIQMPVMDGLTATKAIRAKEKYKELIIIAMTAHARREDKQRSLAAGMNLHIAKPLTAELLLSSILQAMKLTKKV